MSKYCTECGAENLDTANFCRSCGSKLDTKSSEEQVYEKPVDEKTKKGYDRIAGWLILLGLGVFFMPFSLIASLAEAYNIDPEILFALTDQASETYNHAFATYYSVTNFVNWSMVIISFSFWYFFFQRKKAFKKLFIVFLVFNIAVQILDIAAASNIFPDISLSASDFGQILRSIIYAAIWIPYLLISERSKQTFVN